MKEIKKNKVVENVKELVAKNQEVIDALKRLSNNISNDQSLLIAFNNNKKLDSLNAKVKDNKSK